MRIIYTCLGSIILLFNLLSCTSNRQIREVPPAADPVQIQDFEAPAWLFDIPKGQYVVGIAWADGMTGSGAEDAAREFAAVSISRNNASFVVDKSIIVTLSEQRELDWNQVGYNVVVSADPQIMHHAFANLHLVEKYEKNGYFIGLFNYGAAAVNTEIEAMGKDLPPWARGNDISADQDAVYGVGVSTQAYLMDAWFEAQENALKSIGKYRLQNVLGRILAINDRLEKAVAMETVTQSNHSYLDKAHIVHIRNHQTSSYRVYLRLSSEK